MFTLIIIERRVWGTITQSESGGHIEDRSGHRPGRGSGRVKRECINEWFEGRTGLARCDGHIQSTADRLIEEISAADKRQYFARVRIDYDHCSIIDILTE